MKKNRVIMKNNVKFEAKKEYSNAQLAVTYLRSGSVVDPPAWVGTLVLPNVQPIRDMTGSQALRELNARLEKGLLPVCPSLILEKMVRTRTVSITPTLVVSDTKDKLELNVEHGVLHRDSDKMNVLGAVTATLVAYETVVMKVNGKPTLANLKWGPLNTTMNMSPVRSILFKETKDELIANPVKARTEFFSRLVYDNMTPADVSTLYYAHSIAGASLPNYVDSDPKVAENLNKIREAKGLEAMERVVHVTTCTKGYKSTTEIDLAYTFQEANVGKRGSENKRGPLTCGYTMFEMPKVLANILGDVRDVLMLCDQFNCSTVVFPEISAELKRVLIANKITVIQLDSPDPVFKTGDPPGSYLMSDDVRDCFHIIDEANVSTKPHFVNQAWVYKDDALEMMELRLEKLSRYAVKAHLNPSMKNRILLPTSRPDRMEAFLIRDTTKVQTGYGLAAMIKRCSLGVSARSLFPRTRCPFWRIDTMGTKIDWARPIIYPQLKGDGVDFSNFTTWDKAEKVDTSNLVFDDPIINYKPVVSQAPQVAPEVHPALSGLVAYLGNSVDGDRRAKLDDLAAIFGGDRRRFSPACTSYYDTIRGLTKVELNHALEGDNALRSDVIAAMDQYTRMKKVDREKKRQVNDASAPPVPNTRPVVVNRGVKSEKKEKEKTPVVVPPPVKKVDVDKEKELNEAMMSMLDNTSF